VRSRVLLAVVAVLIVAGVAIAAGTYVWFFPQQQGTYSGRGTPQTIAASCELQGLNHWCSQGFQVNATNFTVTMCFSDNSPSQLAVTAYFMNASSYDGFHVNSTLTKLGNMSTPGCRGPLPYDVGPGPFYWVWIDTTTSPVEVQYSVSVVVPI
jgi:hypothetical protein